MDASTSIAAEGELRNAPNIFRIAVFWSRWSLSRKDGCPFHHNTAPKSLTVVIHVRYNCRKTGAESPHSDVAKLQTPCVTRFDAITLRSTCSLKSSFLSNHTPSQRTSLIGFITLPFGRVKPALLCSSFDLFLWKWINSVLDSSKATEFASAHSKAVLTVSSSFLHSLPQSFLVQPKRYHRCNWGM